MGWTDAGNTQHAWSGTGSAVRLYPLGMTRPPHSEGMSSAHGSGNEDASEADRTVEQILRVLAILRRRWMVMAVTTVLSLAAAGLAITLLRPQWRASTTIVLHISGPQVLDKVKGVMEEGENRLFAYKEYYETQRNIIASRTVAEQALIKLGIGADPVFLGIDDVQSEAEQLALASDIDPVERLQQLTAIEEVRHSRIVKISVDYPDAELAAEIANAISDAYLEHVRSSRSRTGERAERNLSLEREKAHAGLRLAEQHLAEFKQSHAITSIDLEDRQNIITQNIITLSSRAKEAQAQRIAAQSIHEQAKRLYHEGSLAGATLLPESDRRLFDDLRTEQLDAEREFEQLRVRYGDKWPEVLKTQARLDIVNARIQREGQELLASLDARLRAAQAAERRLEASLAEEQNRALELGLLERDYGELERDARTAADVYGIVAKRDTEIEMANRVEADGIEVLDRATVPKTPVFPPKLLLVAVALLGGLTLGGLLALGVDFRDHRIRGLVDLERAIAGFGIPVLGQLPLLPSDTRLGVGNVRAQRRQRDLYAYLFPQSLMAERCRGIRTSLAFAQGTASIRTIMITSPSSTEGKSSIAINMAMSFCQAQKRVVLVDADMRRPRLHQVFPTPVGREDVGLSSVLSGACGLDQALQDAGEDAPPNLSLLVCGAVPQNPAELLDTPASRKLIADLSERFDVVIIDSPPVLPVTDPIVLARQVDGLVVVARCQSTTRSELQRALTQLRQGDTNLLGVVLNEVDTRQERQGYNLEYYAYHARETGPEHA